VQRQAAWLQHDTFSDMVWGSGKDARRGSTGPWRGDLGERESHGIATVTLEDEREGIGNQTSPSFTAPA